MAVTTPSAVSELAAELISSTGEYAEGMAAHLVATIPELASGDDDLREETRASCEANIAQILRLLKLGVGADELVVPVEAAEWVRGLVRRGISFGPLLRGYRLGHAYLWDRWSQALKERVSDPGDLAAAIDASSAFMFAYVDRISDALIEAYGSEREKMLRSADQLRAETVRALLGGDAIDEEVASGRLGYELRRHHVALRVASSGEPRGLERAATEAAAVLGVPEPLVVASGVASLDVWCGFFDPPAATALDDYTPPDGIRVAVGSVAHGLDGFRRSHVEATQAARIAALTRVPGVTTYARVELVSLLASDLPRAQAFVQSRLGPLATQDEPSGRLRDTVLAFLSSGGSSTRVAKELFVHQNTVTYRVKKAEELLGRRVTDEPIELSCALLLAAMLGDAVL